MQHRYRPSTPVQAPVTLLYAEEGAIAGSRLADVLAIYAQAAEKLPCATSWSRAGA